MNISRFILNVLSFAASAGILAAQTLHVPGGNVGNIGGSNVGIGTTSPAHTLDINGDTRVGGAFRIGELYYSPLQSIGLAIGTERWVKLATIPNNHYVRFQLRSGSSNSEEIAEVKVFGTYHNDRTAISVERQTYNEHLREVRVTGADGWPRTVYVKIRASDYAPSIFWRAMDSKGTLTIHNVEETPSGGLAHLVAGDKVTSTNTNIVTTGNVGIGTASPAYKLDVNSTSSRLAANGYGGVTLEQQAYPNQGALLFSSDRSGYTFFIGNKRASDNAVLPILTMYDTGNVGIGTTSPSHKLAVNGAIRAKEVIVDTGWADYVFADDYRLAPLSEVESHIKAARHLPGIPSAREVAEHGVSMGEMQAKMLAKIEELTLHVIAQEKKLADAVARVGALETENATLSERAR